MDSGLDATHRPGMTREIVAFVRFAKARRLPIASPGLSLERVLAAFADFPDCIRKGAGYGLKDFRTRRAQFVGRRVEEAIEAGDSEKIPIACRLDVAQFAD